MKTTIDQAGRVVIPKRIRERAALKGGAEVEIQEAGGRIEIRRAAPSGELVRSPHGNLTFSSGPGLSVEEVRDLIEEGYRERERRWVDPDAR